MAKTKSSGKDAVKAAKIGKPTEVKDISSVKTGAVTKPSQTPKSKSKEIAKEVATKADKKSKKAKKAPTPVSSSETSESEDAEVEASSASSASSDDESEIEAPAVSKKANGTKLNGSAKPTAPVDDSSDSSESSASSDEEEKEIAPIPVASESAKEMVLKASDSSDESDEASSDESDGENDAAVLKKAAKVNSADPESEDSDASSASSEDESEKEAPVPKKRKAEPEATLVAKKFKAEAPAGDDDKPQNNLFVGNLSWNIDEAALTAEFEKFGELQSVRIITDKESGRSRGFGYVEFVDSSAGAKAQKELHGTMLDDRELNIDFANNKKDPKERSNQRQSKFGDSTTAPSETLFVANIAFGATEDIIGEAFGAHGQVQSVRLPTDMESGQPKGFGYVTFGSIEDATTAMQQMSGAVIEGRPIRLDFAGPRPDRNAGDRGGRGGRGGFDRGGRGGGRGRGGFDRGGRGGRGGFDRGGRGGGRGGSTNRGGFGDFKGKKMTF